MVLRLLLCFWDISEGKITVDGRDIRDISLFRLHSGMALMAQDTFPPFKKIRGILIANDLATLLNEQQQANRHDRHDRHPPHQTIDGQMPLAIFPGRR
jgi:ABC-type transport system involved in Fe-S cluster assembly fused permease/ATPase subunit